MDKNLESRLKKHFRFGNLVMLLIGIIVIFAIVKIIDAEKIISILKTIDPWYVIFFLYLKTLSYLIWNYKWMVLIEEFKPMSYMRILPVFMAGLLINNLTPGPTMGGEPVKAYYLSKQMKKSYSECLAITVMDTVINIIVFVAFVIVGIIYLMLFVDVPVIANIVKVMVAVLVAFGVIIAYFATEKKGVFHRKIDKFLWWIYNHHIFKFLRNRFRTYGKFRKYIDGKILNFKNTIKYLWNRKKQMVFTTVLAVFSTLFVYARTYVLFVGIGYPITFIEVVVALTISGMIGYYALLPGGTGVMEVITIIIFTAMGIPVEIAATVTLLDRALFYLYTYGVGYVSLSYLHFKYK